MNFFKKALIMLLIFTMLLGASSCGLKADQESSSDSDSDYSDDGSDIATGNGDAKETDDNGGSTPSNPNIENIEGTGEETKNDFSRYSIIANKNNAAEMDAATALSAKLTEKGFSLQINKSSIYEIIIGDSMIPEAKQTLQELNASTKDYIVKFLGTKIIIMAKNKLALTEACDTFYETYIKPMKNKSLTVKDGTTTFGIAQSIAILSIGGISQYEIVFGNVSASVKTKAEELVTLIKAMAGVTEVKSGATYNKAKKQILIGPSAFSETAAAIKTLQPSQCVVSKTESKIVVSGKNDESTISAITKFMDIINKAKAYNTKKGDYALAISGAILDTFCAPLSSVPRFTGGVYSTTYPSGAGITQQYYTSASANKLNDYVTQIEHLGYKKTEDNSINGNRFITCYGKNGLVHISYLNHNKTVTVILDSLSGAVYKESEPAYTKVTETSLAVMTLDYDTTQDKIGSNYDASGMSYVITLEDGRYIVIDGGYGGAKDHHILFNYLKNNNKRKDGKIVIAAWVFTHDHSDHYGCFVDFSSTYGTRVTLQYYLMNCGDKSRYSQTPSGWLPGTSKDGGLPHYCLNVYFKDAKKIVPHTGQKITFCNTTFEVMSTQESHTPSKMEWVNDSSIILRMNANGVKTIFLADAESQTTNLLNNMYGSTLKSDIMQIAHHGYSGGSTTLYQRIAPKYTLWPTSQECFNQRTTGGGNGNAQSQNRWARNNSTCFVGDDNIEILSFAGGTVSVTTCAPNKNKG